MKCTHDVYLAGPTFTTADRLWNKELGLVLEDHYGLTVFLPQRDVEQSGASTPEGARQIFLSRRQGIALSRCVLACLDGADADSGACWELGYAHGLGHATYWYRTDSRGVGGVPGGVNAVLSGGAKRVAGASIDAIARNFIHGVTV